MLSRFRFVRFETDEQQATSPAMPAECFEILGGVPKVVLADRVGCMKGGVVANIVVPDPDYVRYATHYRFRPDFCHAVGPESKGIVENLVGYAKDDLGEVRIDDAHYDRPRPTTPHRAARCQDACRAGVFLALGATRRAVLTGAPAAGVTKLGTEPLLTALERSAAFGRWRAADVRSILATGGHAPRPTPAGQALVLTLPSVPTRLLDAYRTDTS